MPKIGGNLPQHRDHTQQDREATKATATTQMIRGQTQKQQKQEATNISNQAAKGWKQHKSNPKRNREK